MPVGHLYILFWEVFIVYSSPCPIKDEVVRYFFVVVEFVSALQILKINTSFHVCVQLLSPIHQGAILLELVKKLFNFILTHLFIFVVFAIAIISLKIPLWSISQRVLMLSSMYFYGFWSDFEISVIHFKLFFEGCEVWF